MSLYLLIIIAIYLVNCSNDSSSMEEMVDCTVSDLALEIVSTVDTECGINGGKIEWRGIGGSGNYQYSLNAGPQQASGTFENLPTGIHFIKVRDAAGCTVEDQVTLLSGISLTDDVFDRISSTCALAGCHVAGAQSPNFELKSNILTAAQNIKRRLEDNSMPPPDSGKDPMSDADKAIVICWINDGAVDN